jgi:transcriptional regulator NrdR family protein
MEIKPGELRCPRCFKRDIVPSLPRGIMDAVMKMFHRIPRHCRACGKRFYALETIKIYEPKAAEKQLPAS